MLTIVIMRYRHAGKICSGDYADDATVAPYLRNKSLFLTTSFYSIFFFAFSMMSGASLTVSN